MTARDRKGNRVSVGDKVIAPFNGETKVVRVAEVGRSLLRVEWGRGRSAKVPANRCLRFERKPQAKVPPKVRELEGEFSPGDWVLVQGFTDGVQRSLNGIVGMIQGIYAGKADIVGRTTKGQKTAPKVALDHLKKIDKPEGWEW